MDTIENAIKKSDSDVRRAIENENNDSNIIDRTSEHMQNIYDSTVNIIGNAGELAQDFAENPVGTAGELAGAAAATVVNLAADVISATPAGKLVNGLLGAIGGGDNNNEPKTTTATASYYIPSLGAELDGSSDGLFQSSPLLNTYSPRLFGAPHQLTHLCDMRLMSSKGDSPGPVGDFYLENILENGQVANFVIGRAVFTGGMNGILSGIRNMIQYASAINNYGDYINATNAEGKNSRYISSQKADLSEANFDKYKKLMEDSNSSINKKDFQMQQDENGLWLDSNVEDEGNGQLLDKLSGIFKSVGADVNALRTALKTSFAVQQPFYAFDSDWYSYIQRVKMMINSFIVMLGLSEASVRIGDDMFPIAMSKYDSEKDVWANYRFITPTKDLGVVTGIDTQTGDTSQYVSFMIDPTGSSESYTNAVGESQVYASVINQGSSIGNEIAFITNSSQSAIDDAIVNIASKSINAAEAILTNLGGGIGRFTASVAGSMAKSYVGDHTIYPQIYQSSTATTSKSITMHLQAAGGDPYSYLMDICVPLSFIMCMVLPEMSRNTASAYSFPPIVQCNIPGLWGTRLGMVTQVDVSKNPSGKDFSVHGYPLAVDVNITVTDLQHVMVATGMDKPAMFLNNNTMFDYIAQCSGVDKYRPNGSVRLITKLTLGASALSLSGTFANIGNALHNDLHHLANKVRGTYSL